MKPVQWCVSLAGMDPLARLMEGAPLPGVLGATRDARPRGALVHASLAAAPAIGDKKGRHLTGTFCLTGDTMEGIIQCLVFLKAFSVSDRSSLYYSKITVNKPLLSFCIIGHSDLGSTTWPTVSLYFKRIFYFEKNRPSAGR